MLVERPQRGLGPLDHFQHGEVGAAGLAALGLGVTGASSLIAPMMPPSIPAIIYAVTAGVSVGALFVAGIVPAVLLASIGVTATASAPR